MSLGLQQGMTSGNTNSNLQAQMMQFPLLYSYQMAMAQAVGRCIFYLKFLI